MRGLWAEKTIGLWLAAAMLSGCHGGAASAPRPSQSSVAGVSFTLKLSLSAYKPCDREWPPRLEFSDENGRQLRAAATLSEGAFLEDVGGSEPCYYIASFRVRLPKAPGYVVLLQPPGQRFSISYETLRANQWIWSLDTLR